MTEFTTTRTDHGVDCPGCAAEAVNAITIATVTGSRGATSSADNRYGRLHLASVHRTDDLVDPTEVPFPLSEEAAEFADRQRERALELDAHQSRSWDRRPRA